MVVPNPRWNGCAVNMPVPLRKGLGIGDQTFGFLKALEHTLYSLQSAAWLYLNPHPPRFTYFEYNSTMSCSFN